MCVLCILLTLKSLLPAYISSPLIDPVWKNFLALSKFFFREWLIRLLIKFEPGRLENEVRLTMKSFWHDRRIKSW